METTVEDAVAQAVGRAGDGSTVVTAGRWTVRIITAGSTRDVELRTQAQVGHLALDLQRLGFHLDVDHDLDVDVLCVHTDAHHTFQC